MPLHFKPNSFYFPNHNTNKQISPINIKLKNKIKWKSLDNDIDIFIFPDPQERLALIQVYGINASKREFTDTQIKAKNSIIPVLNWITQKTDRPLPIVQQNWIEIPSGNIHFFSSSSMNDTLLSFNEFTEHIELRDAKSLYRLGLNNNEPMYSLLSFFRASEAINEVQKKWIKKYREQYVSNKKIINLIKDFGMLSIPAHPVFDKFSEKKLTKLVVNYGILIETI